MWQRHHGRKEPFRQITHDSFWLLFLFPSPYPIMGWSLNNDIICNPSTYAIRVITLYCICTQHCFSSHQSRYLHPLPLSIRSIRMYVDSCLQHLHELRMNHVYLVPCVNRNNQSFEIIYVLLKYLKVSHVNQSWNCSLEP